MDFELSNKSRDYRRRLGAFMDEHIYPNEESYYTQHAQGERWQEPALLAELQQRARSAGLWNLFLPDSRHGAGLTNLEYAPLCELMGRVRLVARGVQLRRARHRQHGDARALRHPGAEAGVARAAAGRRDPLGLCHDRAAGGLERCDQHRELHSSATVTPTCINGRKWWTSGAGNPRCRLFIFMGKTDPQAPKYRQQSMILVPRDAPGITILRTCRCSGSTMHRTGTWRSTSRTCACRPPIMLLGEGRGFEIAQGRLGPGTHPSRHAAHRRGRARAGEDVPRASRRAPPSAARSPSSR